MSSLPTAQRAAMLTENGPQRMVKWSVRGGVKWEGGYHEVLLG